MSRRVLLLALTLAACACPEPAVAGRPVTPTSTDAASPSVPGAEPRVTRSALTSNGMFAVALETESAGPPLNQPFGLLLRVAHATPRPQPDPIRKVQVHAHMPAHGHGMFREPRLTPVGPGEFQVDGLLFHMRGSWVVLVDVFAGTASGQAELVYEVGPTVASDGRQDRAAGTTRLGR